MVRVVIPIDLGTVRDTESSAFALATPLRVDRLIALAVIEALGTRAPQDKRDRALRATLTGFVERRFIVEIDGRRYDRGDDVVLCRGDVRLRFFSVERTLRSANAA